MPCTPTRTETTHRVASRCKDEIRRVGIVAAKVIHQPRGGTLNLGLRGVGGYRSGVYPRPFQLPTGVRDMRATRTTARRSSCDPLAILRINVIPGTPANARIEIGDIRLRGLAGITTFGESCVPLGAPPTDVHDWRGFHCATLVHQIRSSSPDFRGIFGAQDAHGMRGHGANCRLGRVGNTGE